ncbi:MAG: sarcosine oxidase subunit gamma [Pararhodobacter sp.]|nr:sarcosine oxidase subunit gamma [Pararhodobacter sp.]
MAESGTTNPADGLGLPLDHGACRLSALSCGPAWLVAPFPGQEGACGAALAPLGLDFPAPGQVLAEKGARIVWAGRAQALLFDADPPGALTRHAAVTDQADGWARLMLQGADAQTVLARLVPLDLHAGAFPPGRAARTLLGHHPLLLIRDTENAFEIMTYRSMAGSAVHELQEAMRSVAARAALS